MRRARISSVPAAVSKNHCPSCLHQRNGKRPAVRAHFQREVGIGVGDQLRLFRQVLDEQLESFGGLDDVGRNQIMSGRPKDCVQGIGVIVLGRRHQRVDGVLRRSEGLFIGCQHAHRQRQHQENQAQDRLRTTPSGATMAGRRVSSAVMFAWESWD